MIAGSKRAEWKIIIKFIYFLFNINYVIIIRVIILLMTITVIFIIAPDLGDRDAKREIFFLLNIRNESEIHLQNKRHLFH